jgi:hypothetical protein
MSTFYLYIHFAAIEDTWSLKNGQPVPTPGGEEQIYIPKNQ